MPTYSDLLPSQHAGVAYLASRDRAILADEAGYGKTAQAVLACDARFAARILVVTTASARSNWLAEFRLWSGFPRRMQAVFKVNEKVDPTAHVVCVAWSNVKAPAILTQLLALQWDVLILDEAHYAKALATQNTIAVFGGFSEAAGERLAQKALIDVSGAVWALTGTPIPNSPADLYPMLKALFPASLAPYGGRYDTFEGRFCVVRYKPTRGNPIKVIVRGQNEDELKRLFAPLHLRRLPTDLPALTVRQFFLDTDESLTALRLLEEELGIDDASLAVAAEMGVLPDDLGLAKLRRLVGEIKARAAAKLIIEELQAGLYDKVIVFRWHTEVGRILREALTKAKIGFVSIDGSTPGAKRGELVDAFQNSPAIRVFDGQIVAAGEAITLTASCTVRYVETSIVPKDMVQSVRRALRRGQKRPVDCAIYTLPESIDEKLQAIVERKMQTIERIIEQ